MSTLLSENRCDAVNVPSTDMMPKFVIVPPLTPEVTFSAAPAYTNTELSGCTYMPPEGRLPMTKDFPAGTTIESNVCGSPTNTVPCPVILDTEPVTEAEAMVRFEPFSSTIPVGPDKNVIDGARSTVLVASRTPSLTVKGEPTARRPVLPIRRVMGDGRSVSEKMLLSVAFKSPPTLTWPNTPMFVIVERKFPVHVIFTRVSPVRASCTDVEKEATEILSPESTEQEPASRFSDPTVIDASSDKAPEDDNTADVLLLVFPRRNTLPEDTRNVVPERISSGTSAWSILLIKSATQG
jgi:hypothetical protein